MANPLWHTTPYGWRPVSAALPSALYRGQLTVNADDATLRGAFDFIRGATYRGDTGTLILTARPQLRRMARMTTPVYRGEVLSGNRAEEK